MNSTYIEFPEKGVVKVKSEIFSEDELKPNEAIIRNEASIISAGTELARLYGLEEGCSFPFRPGYGSIGRIEKLGSEIKDFKVGDRVFYAGKHASVQKFTHGENHQWAYLFHVPAGIDPVKAAVGCLGQIALTAPNITELRLGDTVAVFGLGTVGILAALFYKLMGAHVIGVDPVKERCDIAKKCGIESVVDVVPDKQVETVMSMTKGKGVQAAVDASGITPVVCNCIKAAAAFGQVVLLGSPRAQFEGNMTSAFSDIHVKGLEVKGAHMWRYPLLPQRGCALSVERTYNTVFELIDSGKLEVGNMISHVIKPEDVPAAYDGLQNSRDLFTCVVIDWR